MHDNSSDLFFTMSSSSKKVTVSIAKLTEFLSKKLYIITNVYVCDDSIRFVEARTAKYQKNFMIYVSQKYKMAPDQLHKIIHITLSTPVDASRQSEYIDKLKGSFVDCDITSVSSRFICIHRNNGSLEIYSIGAKTKGLEDESNTFIVKDTPIQKTIKDVSEVFGNLSEKLTIPDEMTYKKEDDEISIVEDQENGENGEDQENGENGEYQENDEDQGTEELVELEFEDAEGESVSDMAEFIEPPPFLNIKTSDKSSTKLSNNKIPTIDLEDEDIILGIIYHTIELLVLYKNIDTLEEKISTIYSVIEDNENSIRDDRISNIEELAENLIIKIRSSHEKFITEENDLKTQLIQLSSIFDQTSGLKEKIKDDVKYSDAKVDIERVYNQIRNTIRDLNLELLRLRDSFDELLDNVHTSLQETVKY